MTAIDGITNEIMHLFEKYGNEDYDGEPVSQTTHMIQCAMLAMEKNEDIELVLGALLHDIGHLLKHEQDTIAMGDYGVANHEGIGGNYLRKNGFGERICAVVANHVNAKRYLVAVDPLYRDKLSEASIQTLNLWQGGPMNGAEIENFQLHPYFEDIIKVRLWDEAAKRTGMVMLPIQHFHDMIEDYLNSRS